MEKLEKKEKAERCGLSEIEKKKKLAKKERNVVGCCGSARWNRHQNI